MLEQLSKIFIEISHPNLSVLLLLGIALFGGSVGGRIFNKLKIPQVVGNILIGVLLGQQGLNIITRDIINTMQPLSLFALGLIAFMIGSELKKETLVKFGKQFIYILLFEGLTAFIAVSVIVTIIASFFLPDIKQAIAFGLLLGAISSATAAAGTTDVLWEYKTRGPLTTMTLGIVALDDGLALMLFAVASSVSSSLVGRGVEGGMVAVFVTPLYEIGGSFIIGTLTAFVLKVIIERCHEDDNILGLSIGTILLVLGLAIALKLDTLLTAMVVGMIIVNKVPRKSKEIFDLVGKFTPPIYVLFFVLFGAKLNLSKTTPFIALIAGGYLVGRTVGKMFGAKLGAKLSNAPITVQKYLPACLFSQSGVAIGLSIVAGYQFPDLIGNAIVIIITTTTFIVQILGPICIKWAIVKAGEVGLNITEEDLIKKSKAVDIMDSNIPLIYAETRLPEILNIFTNNNSLHYPVVNRDKKLLGVITVEQIKNLLMATGFDHLVVAYDIMENVTNTVGPKALVSEVKNLLSSEDLNYLPVVEEGGKYVGLIEAYMINRLISKRLLALQQKAAV